MNDWKKYGSIDDKNFEQLADAITAAEAETTAAVKQLDAHLTQLDSHITQLLEVIIDSVDWRVIGDDD